MHLSKENSLGDAEQQVGGGEDTNVPLVVGTTVPTGVIVAGVIAGGCWWLMAALKRKVCLSITI